MWSGTKKAAGQARALERNDARAAILEAARKLIARNGLSGLSLSAVAEEAGFVAATVYGHFRSKDELALALAAEDPAGAGILLREPLPASKLSDTSPDTAGPTPPPEAIVEMQQPREQTSISSVPVREALPPKEANVLSLVKDEAPLTDTSTGAEEKPRSDAWLERRLRVFEHALTDLERRLNDGEGRVSQAIMRSEENAKILVERIAFFERKQEEFQAGMTQRLEEAERRQRGLAAELRAAGNDGVGRLEKLEAWRRSQLAKESALTSSAVAAPPTAPAAVAPVEQQAQTAPSTGSSARSEPANEDSLEHDGYQDAAERVASAAEALSSMEQCEPKEPRSNLFFGKRVALSRRQNLTIGVLILACFALGAFVAFRVGEAEGSRRVFVTLPHTAVVAARQFAKPSGESHAALKPLDRLSSLANSGNAKAELLVGLMYLHGEGSAKDPKRAAQWIGRAASQHDPVAQYWIGSLYDHGDGVAKDTSEAMRWYLAAATQGNRKAMHALGVAYASGSAQKDLAQAAQWFERAAAMGYVNSQFNLAVLCERGEGVPQSLPSAYKWYTLAAAQGDAESRLRADALRTQLSADDLSRAQHEIDAFHPVNVDRGANIPPVLADLSGKTVLR